MAAKGRCCYCGSLAVEKRPVDHPDRRWDHVGRRIGSLEHVVPVVEGGRNTVENLAWCCLWCNTWPSERTPGATDHGGFHPTEPKVQAVPRCCECDCGCDRD